MKSSTNKIGMRTSRNSINPQINIATSILIQVGHCSLEKTMETLVLLGNLVMARNGWDQVTCRTNELDSGRWFPITHQLISKLKISLAIILKRKLKKITNQTAPTRAHVRKFESSVYTSRIEKLVSEYCTRILWSWFPIQSCDYLIFKEMNIK